MTIDGSKILQTKIISITWLPGSWKSFFAMYLASFYDQIFSNLKIYCDDVKMSNDIITMEDIAGIWFHEKKSVTILDEWALNFNSRRSMSNQNLSFIELGVLSRKHHTDIIHISQRERFVDVWLRELSWATFELESYYIWKDYLIFEITVKNRFGQFVKTMKADLFEFSQKHKWTFSTLEQSRIEKQKKEPEKRYWLEDLIII